MYRTDTTQSWTQCSSICYPSDTTKSWSHGSSICILQIQLNLELKVPQYVSYRYNSITNSRFLNMYRTDTAESRTQGSSTCIVQIQLNHKLKVPQYLLYRYSWITNSRFLNMYGTTQSRTQGSFNLYLSFKIQLQLTIYIWVLWYRLNQLT